MSSVKIIFAVDSPLYAPVHLVIALAEQKRPGFEHVVADWDVEKPPELDKDRKSPSEVQDEHGNDDPFMRRVAINDPDEEDIGFTRLGLGDPMRIATLPAAPLYPPPKAVGRLISKMCYWAIDSIECPHGACYLDQLSELLVHPLGMTGYAVPLYHLKHTHNKTDDSLRKAFMRISNTTRDRDAFQEKLTHHLDERSPNGKPPGYVTPDPFDGKLSSVLPKNRLPHYALLHDYSKDSEFSDLVMTAFLAPDEVMNDPEKRKAIARFLKASADAVDMLHSQPKLASWILYRYSQSLRAAKRKEMMYYSSRSPKKILEILKFITGLEIYHPEYTIERAQWAKSQQIHAPMDNLIPKLDRLGHERRKVSSLEYSEFVEVI